MSESPELITPTSFLFWNVHKRDVVDRVARMAIRQSTDMIILAECRADPAHISEVLTGRCKTQFHYHRSNNQKLQIFSRFSPESVIPIFDDQGIGVTMREIRIGSSRDILLVAVHLPSKINRDFLEQADGARIIARAIESTEAQLGNDRTIVIGDFNMNPYEIGMYGSPYFHAVMTREIAERGSRIIAGQAYRFFYNPMWSLFGDRTDGPPGSYYYPSSRPNNAFWHIYDQLLLRPSLMHRLDELKILDHDGEERLLSETGLPKESAISDHLPLSFRLNL